MQSRCQALLLDLCRYWATYSHWIILQWAELSFFAVPTSLDLFPICPTKNIRQCILLTASIFKNEDFAKAQTLISYIILYYVGPFYILPKKIPNDMATGFSTSSSHGPITIDAHFDSPVESAPLPHFLLPCIFSCTFDSAKPRPSPKRRCRISSTVEKQRIQGRDTGIPCKRVDMSFPSGILQQYNTTLQESRFKFWMICPLKHKHISSSTKPFTLRELYLSMSDAMRPEGASMEWENPYTEMISVWPS